MCVGGLFCFCFLSVCPVCCYCESMRKNLLGEKQDIFISSSSSRDSRYILLWLCVSSFWSNHTVNEYPTLNIVIFFTPLVHQVCLQLLNLYFFPVIKSFSTFPFSRPYYSKVLWTIDIRVMNEEIPLHKQGCLSFLFLLWHPISARKFLAILRMQKYVLD